MKRFNWLLIGSLILILTLLVGCGVSKSEYEALQADYDELNAEYEAVGAELAGIEAVYPPRDFSSLQELKDWLLLNDVSERSLATTAESYYSKALDLQEDALKDGYIVSANFDYTETEDLFYIACITIINGDIWWWDPETDEPIQYFYLGKVK